MERTKNKKTRFFVFQLGYMCGIIDDEKKKEPHSEGLATLFFPLFDACETDRDEIDKQRDIGTTKTNQFCAALLSA